MEAKDFNNLEELKDFVYDNTLHTLRNTFIDGPAKVYLDSITNNTSFWKDALVNVLIDQYTFTKGLVEEVEDEEPKRKFIERLSDYLSDYNISRWNKLTAYLISKDINLTGLIQTCFDLQDEIAIINKLKSLARDGRLKKKDLLNSLEI